MSHLVPYNIIIFGQPKIIFANYPDFKNIGLCAHGGIGFILTFCGVKMQISESFSDVDCIFFDAKFVGSFDKKIINFGH